MKTNRALYEYLKLLREMKVKPKKLRFVTQTQEIGVSFLQLRNLKDQNTVKEFFLDMQYTQLPCESAIGIASHVSKLSNLKSIKLNFTDCTMLGNKGFQGVVIKLFRVTELEEVSLIFNQCRIDSVAIQHLVERIGQLTKLKKITLGLRQNNLDDSNIAEIGKALNLCKTLEHIDLDLSYNSSLQNPSIGSLDLSQLQNLKHFSLSIQASKINSPSFLILPKQLEELNLNFITISPFNYHSVLDTFQIVCSIPLLKKLKLLINNTPFSFISYEQPKNDSNNDDEQPQEQQEEGDEEEDGEEGAHENEEGAPENEEGAHENEEVKNEEIEQEVSNGENKMEEEEKKEYELTEEQKKYKEIQDELFYSNIFLEDIQIKLTFKSSGIGSLMSKLVAMKSLKSLYLKNRFGTALNGYDIQNLRTLIKNNESLNSLSLKFSQNQVNVQELNSILDDLCSSDRWIHLKLDLSQTANFDWEHTLEKMATDFQKLKNLSSLYLNFSSNSIEGEHLIVFSQRLKLIQSLVALKLNLRGNNITLDESKYICFNLRWLEYLAKLKLQLGVLTYDEINEEGILESKTTIDESIDYKKLMQFVKHRESDIVRISLFDTYFREAINFNPNILICDFYY